jgi:ubiquinone/menaquinone biosynthesis C-methylase UbiE
MNQNKSRVCPTELAGSLDNKLRRWFQNPQKIIAPYVKAGMTVVDVGCGPGFFSVEMARIVGLTGKVIAVDLQQGMLEKLRSKIKGTEAEKIIQLQKAEEDRIGVLEKADFIVCFYMVHEVPDKDNFFRQLKNILAGNGRILIVEPPFHVSKKEFAKTLGIAKSAGLAASLGPKIFLSQTAILMCC